MKKRCLAVITARGGSKRIPRKNIKDFCGKPIMAYSIEAALESNIFDEVMVSTDDEEIKEIALKYGAKVPFMRSEEASNDMATTHEVILEVLRAYKELGTEFDYVCCIYPTAPFVTKEKLQEGFDKITKEEADTVIPIVAFSFPPQRCFIIKDEKVSFKWPENRLKRSQDLEKLYHDAGQFYFLNVERFQESENMIMENTVPIIVDEMEVQDIDNEVDWKLAELKYQLLKE
ncbi:MAG: pseudaminic acid cytidylyltransferase [Lachnospiraceae bacterium]|nr:pseudaminic acid cytidylyltransferase [Lachnospiraceae bacterium]